MKRAARERLLWLPRFAAHRRRELQRRPETIVKLTDQATLISRPLYGSNNLNNETHIIIKVASFTFKFRSTSSLDYMITHFKASPRGGERRPVLHFGRRTGEGEQTPWSSLPMWLKNKKYRPIVLKALIEARKQLA